LHRHLLFRLRRLSACSICIYFFVLIYIFIYIYLSLNIHIYVSTIPHVQRKYIEIAKGNCIFITPLGFLSDFLSPLYTCCLFITFFSPTDWVCVSCMCDFLRFAFLALSLASSLAFYIFCVLFLGLKLSSYDFPAPCGPSEKVCSLGKVKFIMWIVVFKDKFYGFLVDSREPTA